MQMKITYNGDAVAYVKQDEDLLYCGRPLGLRYSDEWVRRKDAFPVSLSMSLDKEANGDQIALWLANLLPEGEQIQTIARLTGNTGAAPTIAGMGLDTAGALQFNQINQKKRPPSYKLLSEKDIERILNELPRRPFLVGRSDVMMSLAGAQEKLPVAVFDGQIYLPLNGASSTHIMKPDSSRFPLLNENEATCMALAERALMNSVKTQVGKAGVRTYLLVERHDRIRSESGEIERVHQEDFCQALGIPPNWKYETKETNEIAARKEIMDASMRGLFSVARKIDGAMSLLDGVVFNVLIGNFDAHAKNYSILLSHGKPRLAPLYDLTNSMCYTQKNTGRLTQALSQSIGGRRTPHDLRRKEWERFADEVNIPRETVIHTIERLNESVQCALNEMEKEGFYQRVIDNIRKRSAHVTSLALTQIKKREKVNRKKQVAFNRDA